VRSDPQLHFSDGFRPGGIGLPGRDFQDGVSQSGHERNHLFLNVGARQFEDVSGVSGADSPADGRAYALLDYDRDGWQDIVAVNANAPLTELFHNQMGTTGGAPGHFIALRFAGANHDAAPRRDAGNRDGIGALVEVAVGGAVLVREHRGGDGLAAQNSSTILIGIGTATAVDEVRVRWPSGVRRVMGAVPAGSLVTAYEAEQPSPISGFFAVSPYR